MESKDKQLPKLQLSPKLNAGRDSPGLSRRFLKLVTIDTPSRFKDTNLREEKENDENTAKPRKRFVRSKTELLLKEIKKNGQKVL